MLDRPEAGPASQPSIVLNESAARVMGFADSKAAVGQRLPWVRWAQTGYTTLPPTQASAVVGVVPDFTFGSIRTAIEPTLYYVDPNRTQLLLAKLDSRSIPETRRAVDAVWRRTGHLRPASVVFENR